MSMKQEIETWVAALQHYDQNEFEEAIRTFGPIADTSKILFNCGVIRATLGEHEAAIQYYQRANALDQYLAIAYFQSGVSSFLLGEFEDALRNFNDTLLYLRGNRFIDYEQLGLKFKLYSCEVLFNRGLSYTYLQFTDTGLEDLKYAANEKQIPEHDVIDEAIRENAEGYTVFSIPVGIVFRPSDAKVKNVRARDYLGKPTLIAQARPQNQAGFHGNVSADVWARDDRPADQISFGATNLVRPGLSVRTRQQSEPPMHRNMYPPTPPPEVEKPPSVRSGSFSEASVPQQPYTSVASPPRARSRSSNRRPEPLELGVAAFERAGERRPRMPARSASERPVERRRMDCEDQPRVYAGASDLALRSKPTRERLFGALDNELPDPRQSERAQSRSHTFPKTSAGSRPHIVEEEEEEVVGDGSDEGLGYPTVRSSGSTFASSYSGFRRPGSRAPAGVRRIRVKVHLQEDTRYIIATPDVTFEDFLAMVMRKFALDNTSSGGKKLPVKLTLKDEEGDMITVADQSDLDMFMGTCKEAAIQEGSDMGKLEVWVTPL